MFGIFGYIRADKGICGYKYVPIYGYIWVYMGILDIFGYIRVYLGIYGFIWVY